MKSTKKTLLLICLTFVMLTMCIPAFAQEPTTWQPPDNVAGHWVISAQNWDGVADTKTIDLWQNGGLITGQFRGPDQAGSLNGTVNIHHIVFRTNTHTPLTFRGRVEGNTIQGTYNVRGKQGVFTAWRQGP
jgi:hypothetical protein